jgi:hypothetical protein
MVTMESVAHAMVKSHSDNVLPGHRAVLVNFRFTSREAHKSIQ